MLPCAALQIYRKMSNFPSYLTSYPSHASHSPPFETAEHASMRSDTARLWTSLTAAAVGADALAALPVTVPDHCYFPLYGPDFRMATREKTLPDKNDDDFLDR